MSSTATGPVFGPHPGALHAHEQVVFGADEATGLRAIVGIYSTALGPALGGTRFYPYAEEAEALADVLELSRAMAYKNALAGLDHGGGKAVIIGDPATDKSEALLLAYGRFVQSPRRPLRTRPATSAPTCADMDVVARECQFATGRSPDHGGAGDSSVLTAYGVFQGMRAGAEHLWGAPTLAGRTVGVAGVGKVGRHLVGHLVEDGATVVVTDVSEAAVEAVRAAHPGVEAVGTPRRWCGPTWTSTRRARWGTRSPTRWWPCCRPGWSAAAPTTSWPTRASRTCWPRAASSTRRTTA